MDEVSLKLHSLVREVAPISRDDLGKDLSLREDLGFDSITFLELIVGLEAELGLPTFTEEETLSISTLRQLEELVLGKHRERGGEWDS